MPEFKLQRFRGGWAIAAYEGGKRVSRRSLGASDATEAAREFERLKREAMTPVAPTLAQVWPRYIEDRAGRAIAENMRMTGNLILPMMGTTRADAITISQCRAYTAKRREHGRKDGTIHTELGHLRIVLRWAEKHGLITKAPAIDRPSASPAKDDYLTRQDFARLVEGCSAPHVRLFCHLAIATGGREAALLQLTWDRVDFNRGLIFLGKVQAIRPQKGRATVPMTSALRAALSEAQTGALSPYVIEYGGKPIAKVKTGLIAASQRAGLAKVTPHMLRHSAAVWMAQDGVPMGEIAQYLGHSNPAVTARVYAVYSPDFLRRAALSLEV